MKNKILILAGFVLFTSCGVNRIYTSASFGNLKTHTAKPIYKDSTVSSNYVSGSLSYGINKHDRDNTNISLKPEGNEKEVSYTDTKVMGSFAIHRSTSLKYFNYYYGLTANYGSYTFKLPLQDAIVKNEQQSFLVINPKIGFSIKKTSATSETHFIGLEITYHKEFGEYHRKLNEIPTSNSIIVVNPTSLYGFNVFAEQIYKFNNQQSAGFSVYIGNIIGLNHKKYNIGEYKNKTRYGGGILHYRYKKCTFSFIKENTKISLQDTRLGVSYQF